MKKDQLTKAKTTKKTAVYKQPTNIVASESLATVEEQIIELIRYQYTANNFLYKVALFINGTAPNHTVNVHSILSECYQIPHLDEQVCNIISSYSPDLLNPRESAELAAKEIRKLHHANVSDDLCNEMILTTKMIAELLYNGALMGTFQNIMESKCINSKKEILEFNGNSKDAFDYGCIETFIQAMLHGEDGKTKEQESTEAIFRIMAGVDITDKKVNERLLESAKLIVSLTTI